MIDDAVCGFDFISRCCCSRWVAVPSSTIAGGC